MSDDTKALRRLNRELLETVPTGRVQQLFHGGWSLPGYNSGKMSFGGSERFFEMPVPDGVPDAHHKELSDKWQDLIDTLRRSQAAGLIQMLQKRREKQKKESENSTPFKQPSFSSLQKP